MLYWELHDFKTTADECLSQYVGGRSFLVLLCLLVLVYAKDIVSEKNFVYLIDLWQFSFLCDKKSHENGALSCLLTNTRVPKKKSSSTCLPVQKVNITSFRAIVLCSVWVSPRRRNNWQQQSKLLGPKDL